MEHLQEHHSERFEDFQELSDYFVSKPEKFHEFFNEFLKIYPAPKWWWYDTEKEGHILIAGYFFDVLKKEIELKYKFEVSEYELKALFRNLGLLQGRNWLERYNPINAWPEHVLRLQYLPEI